ncbi:hypothetical protein P872_12590 [Rhodonellum psychrophilum GCM71 = DSM 17998]|uniref:Uncharacterized protein n=1 Tax=Rhodonellum psychrophilum GCM71 = DSM 17998 TaxID=1123057 RepID=U5BJJ2_9BACT|nr:hypothetical protein P872_12590 [Rhodonellum psychrophilum GCM71 = DSM 17998]
MDIPGELGFFMGELICVLEMVLIDFGFTYK